MRFHRLALWAALLPVVALAQPRQVVFEGRVVRPDGSPAAHARVTGVFECIDVRQVFSAEAREDGTFSAALLPPTPIQAVRVTARAPGFSNAREVHSQDLNERVLVRLRPAAPMEVLVLDQSGAPITDARVTLELEQPRARAVDLQGRARFEHLNDAERYSLLAEAAGFISARDPSVPHGTYTFRLQRKPARARSSSNR